jgi:hypothetical protein
MAAGCGSGRTIAVSSSAPQAVGGSSGSSGGGSSGGTSGSSGGGQAAGVDFTTQIQPIFDRNCALSGCHAADTASAGQILDAGKSYANIVNVTSTEVPPEKRVLPGDSAHSYLYEKISRAQPTSGSQMPLGADPLPSDQMTLIKTWIDQGAKP